MGNAQMLGTSDAVTTQGEAVVEAARKLIPVLRQQGAAISQARRIPQEIMEMLREARLTQLLRPARFGGREIGADVIFRVARELAKGDGSVAWVYSVTSTHDHLIGLFPLEVQEEYWSSSTPVSASSYMPSGKATPAQGGYTLSGKWWFCSRIENSDPCPLPALRARWTST